ncbi:MAG: nitrous oxide reductase family maturation protein NosD [Bacillus sp. (in: firmicutes)]
MSIRIRTGMLFAGLLFLIAMCVTAKSASAAEYTVSPDESLQEVIEGAVAGDVIRLEEGTHKGPVLITESITLMSEDQAIIEGEEDGHVILVDADDVTIQGLTIQYSGKGKTDSGLYIKEGSGHVIEGNTFLNVMNGMYVEGGSDHEIRMNRITSYNTLHFSERGSGIYIKSSKDLEISENQMAGVQDGLYLDAASNIQVKANRATASRYGFHIMFSEDVLAEQNELAGNITGLMIMDSDRIILENNDVIDQYHVRGFGVIIYDSRDIIIRNNELRQNSTGLSLEKTVGVDISRNIISGNQVGLEFIGENEGNVFTENNFIGNVVQSKIASNEMRLDNGTVGNYWDDYSSFDVTGDGIGEVTYKAGSLYDQLLEKEPYWQLFFESPAIKLWSKAETLFPSIGDVNVYDEKPLAEPVGLDKETGEQERNLGILFMAIPFLWFSIIMIWMGRRSI